MNLFPILIQHHLEAIFPPIFTCCGWATPRSATDRPERVQTVTAVASSVRTMAPRTAATYRSERCGARGWLDSRSRVREAAVESREGARISARYSQNLGMSIARSSATWDSGCGVLKSSHYQYFQRPKLLALGRTSSILLSPPCSCERGRESFSRRWDTSQPAASLDV